MNIDETPTYLEECEAEELPNGNTFDIIEPPPERVNIINDEEKFDDENIDDVRVADVNSDEEKNELIPRRARKPNVK